jgi:prepilin-type N-terminal cleavage/methylation domain-containing protein
MKTNQSDKWQVAGDKKERLAQAGNACHMSRVTCHACRAEAQRRRAFTLVEVLVVIAIIGVIAALIFPVAGAVKRWAFIHTAQAEMSQIETAIERYHSAYGFYPPDSTATISNVVISQLYYELMGMTNIAAPGANPIYQVLGDPSQQLTGGNGGNVSLIFGVAGFMNCSKSGADESAVNAQDFLPGLKPTQIAENITNTSAPGVPFTLLVTADGGPDPTYKPLGVLDVNPWRYNSSSPTNNPGSYDLWVQLQIGGRKYLICNWSSQVQINNPLP